MIVKEETLVARGMKEEDNYLMKTAKVKMDQVREENERLKLTLSRMMKNYHSLKMQFNEIVKEDDRDQPKIKPSTDKIEESDPFVSLSLGRFSGDHSSKRDEKIKADYGNESKTHGNDCKLDGLELGLDCKFHAAGNPAHDHHQVSRNLMGSPENNYSSDESKEEGSDEKRGSRKSPKNSRSGDDEVLQLQNPLKKPRVSVRAVCNTQTMHDGCQWRKYGQKISKGNPCPRAYYRCTVSPSCPVRKQVQRCMDDMTILITTYEGAHNHPLPPAATTMVSATTAAAAMLNSGSTTSPPGSGVSATSSSTTSFGFNFNSSNNIFPRATISTSQSHPTVILDLTPPNHSNNNITSSQNNKLFSSSAASTLFSTPTNSLNFSSSSKWNTNFSSFKTSQPFTYNNTSQQDIIGNEYDQKFSAATKAITRDPSFQSALAAAITSLVGNNVQGRNSNSGLNFDLSFTQPSTSNGSIACATSLLNKFPQISVDYQHKNMAHFAPLTLMSSPKSKAMVSMADEAEQIKLL